MMVKGDQFGEDCGKASRGRVVVSYRLALYITSIHVIKIHPT